MESLICPQCGTGNSPEMAFCSNCGQSLPPQFQQEFQAPAYYKPEPKPGIGSKIWSALGVLAVGLFVILKFGFVLIRASRVGGIALVGVVFLLIVGFGVFSFIKKK